MAKYFRILFVVSLLNIPLSTIWYNYYDPHMLFFQKQFEKEDYWTAKEYKLIDPPLGIEKLYSGGIFAERDNYLADSGVYHRCKWYAYEQAGEDRATNTFCLFFWTPFPR